VDARSPTLAIGAVGVGVAAVATVGAALGLEGRIDLADRQAQAPRHLTQHVIPAKAQEAAGIVHPHLHGDVAVAQLIGGLGQQNGIVGPGFHDRSRGGAAFRLTGREAEVLYWVTKGKTNKDIGDILGTSPRTVPQPLEHVVEKLGVETRTAAANLALGRMGGAIQGE